MGDLPRTFTLQLSWENRNESKANINATLDTISAFVDLSADSN